MTHCLQYCWILGISAHAGLTLQDCGKSHSEEATGTITDENKTIKIADLVELFHVFRQQQQPEVPSSVV